MTAKDHVPIFLLISYCPLCNDYGVLHEHEQYEDNIDPLEYDVFTEDRIQDSPKQRQVLLFKITFEDLTDRIAFYCSR